ncbi:acylamino-acid-releasing enzyme-like isoform X2 [Zerene cesonia]|uniref:acylamino-acid-releasing enzyme-like isoform X2 n=1 Tax=Zerene cesonia TaxID=33412 RepID=UPI0018E571B8|nr:acylamino-acid-releasing enzyme-like isoform X2 [Zerene cesonia]
MSGQIEKIVQVYKTLAKIPSIVSGRLNKSGTRISSKWSVRNLDKGKNSQYIVDYALNGELNVIAESEFGIDVSNELLSSVSPNDTYKAVIREEKNGKDNKKCYLEVWSKSYLAHTIDLTALDVHGDVYADGEFGSLDWSPDEKSLIYIAEQKPKKSEPYIKRKAADSDKNEGSGDKKVTPGEEYIYKPDWGEQLVGKKQSVIVKCDLDNEAITILQGVPEDLCPGQVRFAPDGKGIVGVAWKTDDPRRLGLIYCTNRESQIFWLSFDGLYRRLSKPSGVSVLSPRFTPNGGLLWLQRGSGGPHDACHQLVKLDRATIEDILKAEQSESKETILIDIVQTSTKISNGDFFGVYTHNLPAKCVSADGKRVVFNTVKQVEVNSYVLDMESGAITNISPQRAGSCSVLSVRSDVVLATFSNITTPGQLYVAKLPSPGSEHAIQWKPVGTPTAVPEGLGKAEVKYMYLEHEDSDDAVKSFTAIYVSGATERCPLIVWPHGGPHSAFVNAFALETAMFHLLGFASVQINYRGSIGSGDSSVRFLPQRIGRADVIDCKMAADEAIKRYSVNENKLCLFGGSHGGFLVAHLSGQYPDFFRVTVSRNPVIDLSSMASVSDIPDWCYVEAGLDFNESGPVTEDALLSMRRCSPIVHVHKVKTPTALMLGSADKRVPAYQGLEYAKRLHANGVVHKVFMYDDNHALRTQSAEMDNLINGAEWFLTHLKN